MSTFVENRARSAIFNLKPYVPGKPIEEVKRELGVEDIIKMASNENPLGPSPLAQKAAASILGQLHVYPDSNCYELKKKLSQCFNLPSTSILIGNGSDEILKLVAETFLNPGEQVVLPQPTFSAYEFTAKIMDGTCAAVPLADFTHDLPAMLQAVNEQTKLIYICNPNNPTGTIVTDVQVNNFLEKVPDNCVVVFDEAYAEYVQEKNYPQTIKYIREGKNVILVRTFSKIYGLAGLRVGYAVGPKHLMDILRKVVEPFSTNKPAQAGALAALQDRDFLKMVFEVNEKGKRYLNGEFAKLGMFCCPSSANFLFVNLGMDVQYVFQRLLEQGIIIRPGNLWNFPQFARITIGTPEQNEKLIQAMKNIVNNMKTVGGINHQGALRKII